MKITSLRLVCAATLLTGSAWLYAATPKCEVCHNGKHPHTVRIPCDKVAKYLQNHPGDYAGPCQNVSSEKPPKPKPTPTPKPPKPPKSVQPEGGYQPN